MLRRCCLPLRKSVASNSWFEALLCRPTRERRARSDKDLRFHRRKCRVTLESTRNRMRHVAERSRERPGERPSSRDVDGRVGRSSVRGRATLIPPQQVALAHPRRGRVRRGAALRLRYSAIALGLALPRRLRGRSEVATLRLGRRNVFLAALVLFRWR